MTVHRDLGGLKEKSWIGKLIGSIKGHLLVIEIDIVDLREENSETFCYLHIYTCVCFFSRKDLR